MKTRIVTFLLLVAMPGGLLLSASANDPISAGAARIDISPTGPVQLINVSDQGESSEIGQQLFARALAIGGDEHLLVLLSFDGIGIPASLAESVAVDLKSVFPFLTRDRIAICATHTHWAPHLKDLLGNIFGGPLPGDRQKRVDEYTEFLRDRLVEVARQAIATREPSLITWTNGGRVTFAANRRMEAGGQLIRDEEKGLMITWNPNAPVDHTLPVMAIRDAASGQLRALHFSYACHNVAITGATAISKFPNAVHGDWAGLAQEELERRHRDIVAIATIGCGGDQRPDFCGGVDTAMSHAREICDEIDRLIRRGEWQPIQGPAVTKLERTVLPLAPSPDPENLKSLAETEGKNRSQVARSFVALKLLRLLEQGKQPPTGVPFIAQSWQFPAGGPTFIFLSGEVCIDYQLRIKKEYGDHTWPIAYANATPCYIVSKRMLEKGGYESGKSMFYYGWLRPLKAVAEERVMETVSRVLKKAR
jgi:hypothetical protein